MATVNGTAGKDFIHRLGDGRAAPAGWTDKTGVTTGDDTINGLGGNDFLFGDLGNDILNGGTGVDVMDGGGGNDQYFVDSSLDEVIESSGGGNDRILASVSYVLAANIQVELLTTNNAAATTALNLTGNALVQTLAGNAGSNVLDGKGGADIMIGYGGNDFYYVDNAGDRVTEAAGGGSDRVFASVNYTLTAGSHVEIVSTTNTAGTGAINLNGNALGQSLVGNAGANVLNGMGGADTMTGFAGDDWYYVDNAGDVVAEAAGGGDDRIFAAVSYVLAAGAHVETLSTTNTAGTGTINLTGNGYAQSVVGNAGNNVIDGRGGADLMTGLAGNDTYYVDNAGDVVVEQAGGGTADRILASVSHVTAIDSEIEILTTTNAAGAAAINLTGSNSGQSIAGNAGANILRGLGGNDSLNGGLGADTMYGGTGDDTYHVDNALDIVSELGGSGIDTVYSSVDFVLGAGFEHGVLTGNGDIDLTGTDLNNNLQGNVGANVLTAGGGDDYVNGGLGADMLIGGAGNDRIFVNELGDIVVEAVGGGRDTVVASATYVLNAGVEVEGMATTNPDGNAAINLTGNEFNQSLVGNTGDNVLDGGGGADTMVGGFGNDTYYVDNIGDVVTDSARRNREYQGNDTVYTPFEVDSYGIENLIMTGNDPINQLAMHNYVQGNSAANELFAKGNGHETYNPRSVTLIGGGGADTFRVDFGGGGDNDTAITLADFSGSWSDGDKIGMNSGVGIDYVGDGEPLENGKMPASYANGYIYVADRMIYVPNITNASQLSDADFI